MKVVKIILISLLVLSLLGLGGTFLYFYTRPPQGSLVLLAPGEPITVRVDGGPEVELSARGRHRVKLPTGPHRVEVLAPRALERSFDVEHNATTIVPVVDDQCYATLDVTMSAYEVGGAAQAPRLVRVTQNSEPFALTRGHHTSMAEIPKSRTTGASVVLLRSAPCEDLAKLQAAP